MKASARSLDILRSALVLTREFRRRARLRDRDGFSLLAMGFTGERALR